MKQLLQIGALTGALAIPQASIGQESIIPELTDITSQSILVALSELPVRELHFSSELLPIPVYTSHGGRETTYAFSLGGRDFRLLYTNEKNGGNFSRDFDVTQDSIPSEIEIPENTEIPNFHVYGNISGVFEYDYIRLELAAQIRDGKYCDIWGGIGVTRYRFGATAQIDATGESGRITQDIQGTISTRGTDTLYNPFLSTDINCHVSTGEYGSLRFDMNLHGEIGNANAEFKLAYQYQLSPQVALGIGANIQYHDYYKELNILSNFSDGWTDVQPHINLELYNGRTRISGILSDNGVGISVKLSF